MRNRLNIYNCYKSKLRELKSKKESLLNVNELKLDLEKESQFVVQIMSHIKSLEQKMGGETGFPLIDKTRVNPTEE